MQKPANNAELFQALFPQVECPLVPYGAGVLVQVASALDKIGSIQLPDETKEFQKWTQQLAKVISFGPLCFKNRDTLETWPEGPWCEVGDYVAVRQYSGFRREIDCGGGRVALFAVVQDREILCGHKEGFNPLTLKGWI